MLRWRGEHEDIDVLSRCLLRVRTGMILCLWSSSYALDGFDREPSLGEVGVGAVGSITSLAFLRHVGLSEYVLVWLTELLRSVFPPGEVSMVVL